MADQVPQKYHKQARDIVFRVHIVISSDKWTMGRHSEMLPKLAIIKMAEAWGEL
jgi:hypothetical protein